MSGNANESTTYERVLKHVFSGRFNPGAKLVEQEIADQLGVSRIPIRESLGRLVGQRLLVSDSGGRGIRIRHYTAEEIRQLYEEREILEGGAARAAARNAHEVDLARMEMILRELEREVGNYGSNRWADLDHAFHAALADASHNDRIAQSLKLLLTECHYVHFLYPPRARRKLSESQAKTDRGVVAHMERVAQEHQEILKCLRARDAENAERLAREHMQGSAARINEALTLRQLAPAGAAFSRSSRRA